MKTRSTTKGSVNDTRKLKIQAAFEIRARVAMQLGRESISSSVVAILELVKNAYDADAKNVYIRFSGLGSQNPLLVISDDGVGMTQQQLIQSWMVIGTDNKQASARSSGGRIFTGAKGLGRLGLDRLSKDVVVRSFTFGATTGVELEINWKKYEKPAAALSKITHPIYEIGREFVDPISQEIATIESGTWLILSNLTDKWDKDSLDSLEQELGLLLSPFSDAQDFSIWITRDLKVEPKEISKGSSDLLSVAEWKLVAAITTNGQVSYSVESPVHSRKYEQAPLDWEARFKKFGRLPACGPVRFELFYFIRKTYETDSKTISRGQIGKFLNSNQGVRIYRDGFRVKPYGQPDGTGDWLGLSFRRQKSPGGVSQEGYRIGYNQVVGAVFISRNTNPSLVDQTNRESIVEGDAFTHLRVFALSAIEYLEEKRQEFERENSNSENLVDKAERETTNLENESKQAIEKLREITERVLVDVQDTKNASELVKTIDLLEQTNIEINEKRQELIEAVQQERLVYERQKDTLSNLASLGILSVSFGHETLGRTTNLLLNTRQLNRELSKMTLMLSTDARSNLEAIKTHADRIKSYADFMLSNVSRDKRKRKAVSIFTILKRIKDAFDDDLRMDRSTVLDISGVSPDLPKILAFEIDWESIFINLLTNSVWALQNTPTDKRLIRVQSHSDGGMLVITFSDSGWGIESGTENKIFEPTFSTRRNARGDIDGTGMGLAIVQSFVQDNYKGAIEIVPHCDLGGAQFIIRVPIPDLLSRGQNDT